MNLIKLLQLLMSLKVDYTQKILMSSIIVVECSQILQLILMKISMNKEYKKSNLNFGNGLQSRDNLRLNKKYRN
jgi:hypothetical protein